MRALVGDVEGLTGSTHEIGWVWPNQSGRGAHVSLVAGAVTASGPNRENAATFLAFLTSDLSQSYFAGQNNQFPAVQGVPLDQGVAQVGYFVPDTSTGAVTHGDNASEAQVVLNEVGWP